MSSITHFIWKAHPNKSKKRINFLNKHNFFYKDTKVYHYQKKEKDTKVYYPKLYTTHLQKNENQFEKDELEKKKKKWRSQQLYYNLQSKKWTDLFSLHIWYKICNWNLMIRSTSRGKGLSWKMNLAWRRLTLSLAVYVVVVLGPWRGDWGRRSDQIASDQDLDPASPRRRRDDCGRRSD